ncbi:MAG TPA: ScyD/ScyE family protein [Acidimicrobiales bacterium]|nr:ScyD/ScyE family protein [Acidimicrobiales bacterium]
MKRWTTLACVGLTAAALTTSGAAVGASADTTAAAARPTIDGFEGARGLDIGRTGRTVLATSDGKVYRVTRTGKNAGDRRAIARVPAGFLAPAVAVANDNAVWILTVGADSPTDGHGTLFLKRPGKKKVEVRNIQRWVANHRRGVDPYDLEDSKQESNPYGVAAMPDGSALVADAANNAVFRVTRSGRVQVVARVKPRTVLSPDFGGDPEMPPTGTPMPSEAVTTSVAVGPDGSVYIGELRGFPGTVDTSQVWRVRPGERRAVCDPERPRRGECRRVADGLTSVVSLDTGLGGSIYVAELSKLGWLAMETGGPEAAIGSVIRIGHDRTVRRELAAGEVVMPGAVAVTPGGNVWVSGPIFGPGGMMRVG